MAVSTPETDFFLLLNRRAEDLSRNHTQPLSHFAMFPLSSKIEDLDRWAAALDILEDPRADLR
jgi:hypothetical protein